MANISKFALPNNWQRRHTIVALCFLAVFICYIDRVNISVAVLAMQDEFGWDEKTKGYVLSSFFIGYMLFQIPSGWLANRWGGRIVLGAAVAWWSLLTILTPPAAFLSFTVLILARIAMGLGEAAMFPSAYNLYGRWVPVEERSRSVALLIGGIPLGTLFALLTTGWIVENYGWPMVFYVFGLSGIFWCALWAYKSHNDPASDPLCSESERALLPTYSEDKSDEKKIPWKVLLGKAPIWALIINHFCSNWVLYMLLAWLPSYFRSVLGLSIMEAGIYSAAPWLTMFIVGNAGGYIADWMVRGGITLTTVRKIMQIAGLIGSASCLLAAQDVTIATEALLLMCGALGFIALTWSGFVPNHLDIAPRYADVLMGITNTAGTVPGIIGVALTGWLVDATGDYGSAFFLCASVNIFGAVVWFIWSTAEKIID